MAVSPELEGLRRIAPSRFVSFAFPNPFLGHASNPYGGGDDGDAGECVRVAVLDSPLPAPPVPATAAMLVPSGRHRDWIFSTRAGHFHLLLSATRFSRLILVGPELSAPSPRVVSCARRRPDPDPDPAHARLLPLLLALCPVAAFRGNAVPDVPLLTFQDDLLRLAPIEFVAGPVVGEMVVEDVAVDCSPSRPAELRRRLRFKRMPCLVQTQVRLRQSHASPSMSLEALEGSSGELLQPEVGGPLAQPYLQAMVAGLAVTAPSIEKSIQSGARPRCLCAGVGGGSLLMSLRVGLQFDVLGIEADGVVLDVARSHFGLVEDEFLRVHVGDAIQTIEGFAAGQGEPGMNFSAVMVDLDSSDAMCGVSAPPLEMARGSVLLSVRTILNHHGVLILNVIPPPADKAFYKAVTDLLRQFFSELYEIDVGNGENFVLVATVSPVETTATGDPGQFLTDLRNSAGDFLERIRKI